MQNILTIAGRQFRSYWNGPMAYIVLALVLGALGWQSYADADSPYFCTLPPTTLGELVAHLKRALGIGSLRVVGPPDMACRRVALLVGSPGGRVQIEALGRPDVDVAICGEIMTMPGLPKSPAADRIRLDANGAIEGLF